MPGHPAVVFTTDAWLHDVHAVVQEQLNALTAETRASRAGAGEGTAGLVALVAAGFGDRSAAGIVPAGVAAELVDLGCHYHDDIFDSADSAARRDHNERRVLHGDLLLVRALQITAGLGSSAVTALARAVAAAQEAAIEARRPSADPVPNARARHLAACRTAAMWTGAVELGCLQARVAPPVVVLVRRAVHHAAHGEVAEGLLGRLPAGTATDRLARFVATAPVARR